MQLHNNLHVNIEEFTFSAILQNATQIYNVYNKKIKWFKY